MSKASFLPLMSIQSHRRPIGYSMPVRQYASASDATAQSNAARARLRGVEPVVTPEAPAMPEEPTPVGADHLNMLTMCSWRFLVRLAALRHGLSADEVMCRSRKPHIVAARAEALALIYRHTQYSLPGVARIFGLDHTTVLHALTKTGSTDKLVEVLPYMDTARRSKNRAGMVLAAVEPTPIPIPAGKPANAVQRVVRAGYRAGKPKDEIAAAAGIEPASVKVIASRMGLRRSDFAPASMEAAAQ